MAFETTNALRSFLITKEGSVFIRSNGEEVLADELEGKIVGVHFLSRHMASSREFTEKLKGFYDELKGQAEKFEIVSVICHENDEESFKESTKCLPWLVLPFGDEREHKLVEHFWAGSFSGLAVIGDDGRVIRSNVANLIEDHGVDAYPFSPGKLAEFDAMEEARLNAQTLESLLVDGGGNDFVLNKEGIKVPVSELVGKTIFFYFSSYQCPPCQRFKPKLLEAYEEIKAKDSDFDIVYVSCDKDASMFDESYSTMPWLTLPFGDQRAKSLQRNLKVPCIPTLVAVGPNGRTIAYKAMDLLTAFGSDAYPFDEGSVSRLAERWPKTLKHELHQEHELELSPKSGYFCDACEEEFEGAMWSFHCEACDFDLDPKCALGRDGGGGGDEESNGNGSDGWICNGQVCYRA